MDENYSQLLDFVSEKSGINRDEIESRVEAKQAKLAGLISKVGALQIIAAELSISFDKQTIKIAQVVPGMKRVNLIGKIVNLFPIREYNKNGRSGKIGSFILADETSNIRTVLWDENHINLISNGTLVSECIIEINNATLRNGELHLTSFSEIKTSQKSLGKVVLQKQVLKKSIVNFNKNDSASTRAFIVQMFEPKFFNVCPACKKKVSEIGDCIEHGKVTPEKRALVSFVLDDGTDSIRAVAFFEQLEKLMSFQELESPSSFALKKAELLGKEIIVSGQVRTNMMFNNNEFIVSNFEEIDLDKLIQELEI